MEKTESLEEPVSEEVLRKTSPIISDLRHEILSPLNLMSSHIELYHEDAESSMMNDLDEQQVESLSEFVDITEDIIDYTEQEGVLPEEGVDQLTSYAESIDSNNEAAKYVGQVVETARDVFNYQNKLITGETGERSEIGELLEPLHGSAENLGVELEPGYNGLEENSTGVDIGFRVLFWTLGKNWSEHAYKFGEGPEFGFDVEEQADSYSVEVWDTGPGLFEKYPESVRGAEQLRYKEAEKLLGSEEEGGHGLSMASNIAEVYGGSITYSEDMLEGTGFGLEVEVPKYQSSTSESS